jgi:hypothetical protein
MRAQGCALSSFERLVVGDRRKQLGAALAEGIDGATRPPSERPLEVIEITQDMLAEHHRAAVHGHGPQPQPLDHRLERVGADHRIIVDLRDTSLVQDAALRKAAGQQLASDSLRGLEDRNVAEGVAFLVEMPGGHETAGASANNADLDLLFHSRPTTLNLDLQQSILPSSILHGKLQV